MPDTASHDHDSHAGASLLGLLRLVSPALPIGTYAYSRGLEYAVHAGWVHDEASASAWISGLLRHTLTSLDAPIFARLHAAHAANDHARVEHWNRMLLCSRESSELRLEETQIGAAFARLLVTSGMDEARAWAGRDDACYANLFALGVVKQGVSRRDATLGFLWASCESQTNAAVRLIPLGQSAGQRILATLIEHIPACVTRALSLPDDELGGLAPGLGLGSALHETQYTRLFRS